MCRGSMNCNFRATDSDMYLGPYRYLGVELIASSQVSSLTTESGSRQFFSGKQKQ